MVKPLVHLALVASLLTGCSRDATRSGNAAKSSSASATAPIDCLRQAKANSQLDLKHDYMVQLCSGASDASRPIDCYLAARADSSLDLTSEGALMLCSPFNLDAFNAKQTTPAAPPCPSCNLGSVEARLRAIEDRLDELKR